MFAGFLGVALIAGTLLFLGKFFIYHVAMSIFPKRFRAWVYRTPVMLIALDFGFAALAAPIASMAGGTIAMLTMIVFGTWSATYIIARVMWAKVKRWYNSFNFNFV